MNVKRFFLILLVTLMVFVSVFAGVAVAWIYSNPFSSGDHGDAIAKFKKDEITNFLIVGKDHVGENTDVLMVVSLDPDHHKATILNIPRDTRVNLNGSRKINSVYSYAGVRGMKKEETLIRVVSEVSRLPIHYYAIINLRAFRDIVDALGGVEFNVTRPYHYDDPFQDLHIHLNPGMQTLDGKKAEGLIRFRADYQMGDIQRVEVQQEFLSAFISQKLQLKYIGKIPEIYDKVTDYVISNMSVNDLLKFAQLATDTTTETHMLPGSTGSGTGYWIQNDAETDALIREKFGQTDEN